MLCLQGESILQYRLLSSVACRCCCGASLSFQVVCAPAAYKEFALARFCSGAVLYNGGGPKAEGKFQSYASCEDECDHDPRCKFFLWKHEQGTSWVNHCATFSDCSTPEAR